MNKEQAVKILIEAVNIAQLKGAFDLQSAKVVAIAVEVLAPAKKPEENKEAAKKTGTDIKSKEKNNG